MPVNQLAAKLMISNHLELPVTFPFTEARIGLGLQRLLLNADFLFEDMTKTQLRSVNGAFKALLKLAAMEDYAPLAAMLEYELIRSSLEKLKTESLIPNVIYLQRHFKLFEQPVARRAASVIKRGRTRVKRDFGEITMQTWPAAMIMERHLHYTYSAERLLAVDKAPDAKEAVAKYISSTPAQLMHTLLMYLCAPAEFACLRDLIDREHGLEVLRNKRSIQQVNKDLMVYVDSANAALANGRQRLGVKNLSLDQFLALTDVDLDALANQSLTKLNFVQQLDSEFTKAIQTGARPLSEIIAQTGTDPEWLAERIFKGASFNHVGQQQMASLIEFAFELMPLVEIDTGTMILEQLAPVIHCYSAIDEDLFHQVLTHLIGINLPKLVRTSVDMALYSIGAISTERMKQTVDALSPKQSLNIMRQITTNPDLISTWMDDLEYSQSLPRPGKSRSIAFKAASES